MMDPLVKQHIDKLYEAWKSHPGGYQREHAYVRFAQACETAALFLGTTAGRLQDESEARWKARHGST